MRQTTTAPPLSAGLMTMSSRVLRFWWAVHSSNFSISCNRYFQDIDQACNTFSKNVMRATIKAMSIKRQEIDQKIQTCRSELKNVCPVVLVNSIRLKIHDLNSKPFQYLQDHKNQKLFELTGRDPNSNSKPLEQRYNVVTFPEDLPLSEPEKSILGKGLNFVPLTKKTDEFTVKEDTEKFLRRGGRPNPQAGLDRGDQIRGGLNPRGHWLRWKPSGIK